MKAIVVRQTGDASVLQLEDAEAPKPAQGEALVRIEAAGVNFIDVYQRTGLYARPLPFTPGSEGAGEVVAVGPGAAQVAIGDRVVSESFRGTYAELAIAPAERLVRIPAGVTTEVAAAVMLQGLTAHYLTTSTYALDAGDWCVVHAAAGGVGLLLCQLGAKRGAHVIGTASSSEKQARARAAGAESVVSYSDFVGEVKQRTGGRGVHVVYDSVGRSTFNDSLDALAPRGMLVSFGQSSGAVGPIDPLVLSRKGSLFLTRPTLAHYVPTREELLARSEELFGWVEEGTISVRIDRTLPLAEAAEAHRALERRDTSGKVLLKPSLRAR
ncbi:MAG TPA: quinone oxidoreductase [Gemmatimonadaceae bacterium]|nr:quinone oxidoreductase [Gemmatimonadaceae bacterium]